MSSSATSASTWPRLQETRESNSFGLTLYHAAFVPQDAPYAVDYVIISYVCIYVAKTPGDPRHEAVCDELRRLLSPSGGVRAILLSERSEETAACGMMERRGVPVERLVCQDVS